MAGYGYETYGELQPWVGREWLQTNGTGAFASCSLVGANTRRYHGLLIASTMPPVGRVVALNRLSESIRHPDGQTYDLAVNYFRNTVTPHGERFLQSFAHDVTTRWHYDVGGISVRKEAMLCWGRNVCGIKYTIEPPNGAPGEIEFTMQPFVTLRDFHTLMRADGHSSVRADPAGDGCIVQRWGHQLHLKCVGSTFAEQCDWWYGFCYPVEAERGQDDTEDMFTPGTFTATLNGPTTLVFWASLDALNGIDWDAEYARRAQQLNVDTVPTQPQQRLRRAAQDFVVIKQRDEHHTGTTVLAGYPWFGEWGRDTFVSIAGLMLATGKHHQAGQVLSTFAEYVRDGLIPHLFDEHTGEPHYNSVDTSLWFINAVFEYLRQTKDYDTFNSILFPACQQITAAYINGTHYGIKVDPNDGLVTQGDPTTQLTWMDTKTQGVIFTPRHGKAIEINALWYNALRLMSDHQLADKVADSFRRTFYISPYRGCADVVNETGRDDSIRPNQIFAVSLMHSPLHEDQQAAVVDVVRRELLTQFGLRTLSPNDPKFQAKYAGAQFERDRAYHNGAIWPWLIGAFLDAYLKVNHRSADAVHHARRWLQPLIESLEDGCIGSISECYEANPPHRPIAACAQAWSVAEVLRLAIELDI